MALVAMAERVTLRKDHIMAMGKVHDHKILANYVENRASEHFKRVLGGWTVQEAREHGVSSELIEEAIELNLSWRRRVMAMITCLDVGE